MNDILTEHIIGVLLGGVRTKIVEAIKQNKWEKLFVKTGSFLTNSPDTLSKFAYDLSLAFSEENLKQMAKNLNNKSGYEFIKLLHDELYGVMIRYEIPELEAETYIIHFTNIILSYLKENDTDKTMEIFLGRLKDDSEKHFEQIESELKTISHQIECLGEKNIASYSIADIDAQIRRASKYKGTSLNFFELNDEQFKSEFKSAINNENVYIVGNSREETIYRILNELSNVSDRVTLVIKSEEEWIKLKEANVTSGNILIPFFYAEQIEAIPQNTNVFVYGEDEPCYAKNKLLLRKRTKRNIINSLEKIGLDYSEAYSMVESTHGLYVPLKKRLFNVAVHNIPDWVKNHSDVVMAALLCGKWTEATGDTLIFEDLSGKPYPECKKELEKYLYLENPYIVNNKTFGSHNIQLASVEDAWEELDKYITEELWDKFITLFYEVLIESEPIFEYPFDKHFEASVYARKPEWSPTLKNGMIRTLIMRAYYRGHEENQRQIDNIVSKVLDTITNKERWGYISQYLMDLCEASPESVMRKLEDELKKPQGLLDIFKANYGDNLTGRHYYTYVLWAVEQLLQQRKFVSRAVEWLWKVDAYDLKYSISNSPKGSLEIVFCAWTNEAALSVDRKIELAREAVNKYPNAWNLILSEFPQGSGIVCQSLNKPKYRKVDEQDTLFVNDIHKTCIEYVKMCIDSAGTDAKRWTKIVRLLPSLDLKTQNKILDKLIFDSESMCDEEKIKIKNAIRCEIHNNRYFDEAKWSMPEEVLRKYESTMNKITLTDNIYEYIYLFLPPYEFPLLHPTPISREDSKGLHGKNSILREEEIKTKFKEFKEKEYSIERLIDLVEKEGCGMMGQVIAQFYCEGLFDENIFELLIGREDGKYAYDYVSTLYFRGSVDLSIVIKKTKSLSDNKKLLADLISLEVIEKDYTNALITNENEEIKKIYWSNNAWVKISEKADHNVIIWALDNCKKYGSFNSYLELLYNVRKKISPDELCNSIFAIYELNNSVPDYMIEYCLSEILKELHEAFKADAEKCMKLASIEWLCRNVLKWEEMKCTQKIMKESPVFYAQLVRIIFKTDGSEQNNMEKAKLAEKIYSGFDKARFCPAEKDGKVIFENLKNWVDKFKEMLIEQNQESLFGYLIGRLLPYAPVGEDGFSPCESVRKIIEEYYSDSLKNSYVVTETNKRGAHWVDEGKSELDLHHRYKKNAEGLQEQYPRTAEIYFELSDWYKCEAKRERERAEYEV